MVTPDNFLSISLENFSKDENDKKMLKHHNFVWLPIDNLSNFDFKPTFIKEKIINKNYEFEHIIIK